MKNRLLYFVILITMQMGFAQNNLLWKGYFSYSNIGAISESSTVVYAASENALFSKNKDSGQLKTTNTIDGLSGETITSLYYSSVVNRTLVGYENGLMIVINEADGSMLNVVDIINKQLPSSIKKVNHFMEYQGIVYVSCDFGIVQFNLATMLFGDTYFIGNNGIEVKVNQTAVYNGFIYAATTDGLRKANVTNKNLVDFNQWSVVAGGDWSNVTAFGTDLFAVNSAGYIHKYNTVSSSFVGYLQMPLAAADVRVTADYLLITTIHSVSIYNKQMLLVRKIDNSQYTDSYVNFTCATNVDDVVYIGTKEKGLLNTTISVASRFENPTPNGPLQNNVFAIRASPTSLWTVYGDYDGSYNPYGIDSYGISKFSERGWLNIPYEEVLNTKTICSVAINPSDESQVYAGSFFSGLLKIENDVPSILYNSTNSGLQPITGSMDTRINTPTFDKQGNLWLTNSRISTPLKVLKTDGQWQSYSLSGIFSNVENVSFGKMAIDKNETKWLPNNRDGVIGFNEKTNQIKKITNGANSGNLPIYDARVVAVDNNNQLWIGTTGGLRVLSNVNSFLTDSQPTTKAIIILEDDLAQELMYEQFITDIVVDGANNKWIATADAGLFLVSSNGQETKYHFTTKNSPLPSNEIHDVDINSKTGEVFIATPKGLVSFKGVATTANESLNEVFVYPNPVRPGYEGTVKISGLLDKATVKISDIEGNLVHEVTSEGGTIEWDTTAFGHHKVASGVYMVFISAEDGGETKVKKIMIIR